eukprot:364366-Chlamydomonas_euryale.AAC.2
MGWPRRCRRSDGLKARAESENSISALVAAAAPAAAAAECARADARSVVFVAEQALRRCVRLLALGARQGGAGQSPFGGLRTHSREKQCTTGSVVAAPEEVAPVRTNKYGSPRVMRRPPATARRGLHGQRRWGDCTARRPHPSESLRLLKVFGEPWIGRGETRHPDSRGKRVHGALLVARPTRWPPRSPLSPQAPRRGRAAQRSPQRLPRPRRRQRQWRCLI